MGASVHYAGTIPMVASGASLTASAQCRSADFENLFFVVWKHVPVPADENLTLTLMANAVRVAEVAF